MHLGKIVHIAYSLTQKVCSSHYIDDDQFPIWQYLLIQHKINKQGLMLTKH